MGRNLQVQTLTKNLVYFHTFPALAAFIKLVFSSRGGALDKIFNGKTPHQIFFDKGWISQEEKELAENSEAEGNAYHIAQKHKKEKKRFRNQINES